MTSKLTRQTQPETPLGRFPDFPPRDDMQNSIYLDQPAHQAALARHFGAPDTTIILSEIPVAWTHSQRRGVRIPDLLIAFNVDQDASIAQMGYAIEVQGKPPDFVLEIASPTTARNDYTGKRIDYAGYGVPEYWRFDGSGGQRYDAALAGDRLVEGAYQGIEIIQTDEIHQWGHSEVLNLDLCWEDGQLRWWDPAARRYLPTFDEEAEGRIAERAARLTAEAQRDRARQARAQAEAIADREHQARAEAEARAASERQARAEAEARIRELEEEMRRQQGR